jgi:hypothetical protein
MKRVRKTAIKMINRVMAMIGIKIANIPVVVENCPRRATVVA